MSRHKWTIRTSRATEEYKRGVKNPRRSWAKCACEAGETYKHGVDWAYGRGAFQKGVKKSGSKKWQAKSLSKGAGRFFRGVIDGRNNYERGFKPYHSHFPGIRLPSRFPRGDPRNLARCRTVCNEMGRLKMRLTGTGKVKCPDR